MARPKRMENIFKTYSKHFSNKKGGVGYDNPRENVDPHIKTKVINSKEIIGNSIKIYNDIDAPVQLQVKNKSNGFFARARCILTVDNIILILYATRWDGVLQCREGTLNLNGFENVIIMNNNNGTFPNAYTSFQHDSIQQMLINYNGKVKIGTGTPGEFLDVAGNIIATGYKSSDGSLGATGSFTTADGKTVTVQNGLITNIL